MSFPMQDGLPPIHPGELLKDDLEALGISARKFAAHIGVPPNAVTAILNGQRAITGQMALRIGKAFDMDPMYWLRLQARYEAKLAEQNADPAIHEIPKLPGVAA